MTYNIWFNVCALFVLTTLLILYYIKFRAPFNKYKLFIVLVWLSAVSTVASIANNTLPGIAPIWIIRLSNITYFIAHGMIPPVLLLYVYSLTDYSLLNWQRLTIWMIPSLFNMLLVITSWFSDGLFWLDELGGYHRGPMMPLLYMVTGFNFITITIFLIVRRKSIPHRESISVLFFLVLSMTAVVVQMIYPWLLVENFASAMCMMVSQMTVQNPEMILDGSTGMLTKRGFSNLITPQFDLEQPFQVGFLLVDNYHEMEKYYSFSRLESQLVLLANFLKQHPGCIFSRMDNRLFCFFPETSDLTGWNSLMQDLDADKFSRQLQQEGLGIRLQFKIGTLNCPRDVDSFGSLMELIDVASKVPMRRGDQILTMNALDVFRLRRRKKLDELVRTAVEDNSLHLVYQPVYDVKQACFTSAEVLLRMSTGELGNISPAEFIPIAEENGSITKMTEFVVENVCRFLRRTEKKKWHLQQIHINISAVDCAQNDLAAMFLRTLNSLGVSPEKISVEITETGFTSQLDSIQSNLADLSSAGVSIFLDDYGTGYSNLSRLYSIPLDVIKLDKSLVDDILISESARVVLENTIRLMSSLNKKVLVEGVETKEQADYLISQGVDYIQGYYFAHPVSESRLEEYFGTPGHQA